MGEVADMGARAGDDLTIGVDERIGLACERRDFDRERAFEPFRCTGTDGGETLREVIARCATEA
jgi:hypothetical protein